MNPTQGMLVRHMDEVEAWTLAGAREGTKPPKQGTIESIVMGGGVLVKWNTGVYETVCPTDLEVIGQ